MEIQVNDVSRGLKTSPRLFAVSFNKFAMCSSKAIGR